MAWQILSYFVLISLLLDLILYCAVCRLIPTASRNPLEWLPAFILVPLMIPILVSGYLILTLIMFLAAVSQLFALPFRAQYEIRFDGILMKRLGRKSSVIPWAEIAEWHQIKSFAYIQNLVLLKNGKSREIGCFDQENLSGLLDSNQIPFKMTDETSPAN